MDLIVFCFKMSDVHLNRMKLLPAFFCKLEFKRHPILDEQSDFINISIHRPIDNSTDLILHYIKCAPDTFLYVLFLAVHY